MSYHMHIMGSWVHEHLADEDERCFSYCQFCKQVTSRAEVSFHQGINGDFVLIRCCKCKHVIWSSKIKIHREKLNKKCRICGKPTSWNNMFCAVSRGEKRGFEYYCSKKCDKRGHKK